MDKYEKAALAFVNECRTELDTTDISLVVLHRGKRKSKRHCPISESLCIGPAWRNAWTSQSEVKCETATRRYRWKLPAAVSTFVIDFDQGDYPKLTQED